MSGLWLEFLRLEQVRDAKERDEMELRFLRRLLREMFPNG